MTVEELAEIRALPEVDDVGTVYSNFDSVLDEEIAGRIAGGDGYGQHAAWDFCGYVWRDGERWVETVWRYGTPEASYASSDLDELIQHVNDEWGWG